MRQRETTVFTRERDKKERTEWDCREWRREERVGNERSYVDQSESWRPETMRDDVAGRRLAMGGNKRVDW
jgi:hypothetical protein